MTREEILMNAKKCVCGDREEDYGSPENNFATIADLWNVYVHALAVAEDANDIYCPLFTAEEVAMMMALLKIARVASGRTKEDSFIDLAGYAACAGEIATKEKKGLTHYD